MLLRCDELVLAERTGLLYAMRSLIMKLCLKKVWFGR